MGFGWLGKALKFVGKAVLAQFGDKVDQTADAAIDKGAAALKEKTKSAIEHAARE